MLRWFARITTGIALGGIGFLFLFLAAIALAMLAGLIWLMLWGLG